MSFSFSIDHESAESRARTGRVSVRGRAFETPAFMPVGTAATVKSVTPDQCRNAGIEILLCNTYHLHLRPGASVVAAAGGLHEFMGWDGAILTDSGGFQVYSLGGLVRVEENGMLIKSHIDGTEHRFDPESVMAIQHDLDSDIVMAFDQCAPFPSTREKLIDAVQRTTAWAGRCKAEWKRLGSDAALFGIVQGGMEHDLRKKSCEEIRSIGFPGYAVGGLSVGEGKELMHEVLHHTTPLLPRGKPRYLMGVGPPDDIVRAVEAGIDMFDCVMPTRNARNATIFTSQGIVRLRNAAHRHDHTAPDPACGCYTCRQFTRAYLRHLFIAGEMLGPVLATIHNLTFFQDLMSRIRAAIRIGRFAALRQEIIELFNPDGRF